MYGSSTTLRIADANLNDSGSDNVNFNMAGSYAVKVVLNRAVSKDSPIRLLFTPRNTVQLDDVELYALNEECIPLELINGGDFHGTVSDYMGNWPDSQNLKSPGNGKVEINIGGRLGQPVPSQDIIFHGKENDIDPK
jgi:hypothetical protein